MSDLGKHKFLLPILALSVCGLSACSSSSWDWFDFSEDGGQQEEDCEDVYYKVSASSAGGEAVIVPIDEKQAYAETYGYDGKSPYPYAGAEDGRRAPAHAYNAPVGGGAWVERAPYEALNERYGNSSEDLGSSVPADKDGVKYISMYADDCEDSYAMVGGSRKVTPIEGVEDKDIANLEKIQDGTISGVADNDGGVQDWMAPEGSSLRSLLMDWSDKSGWKLVWKTDREYILEAGAMFRGKFVDVASAIVRTFARARPAPIATFYNGNRVLVVTTLEDENAD